MHAVAVGMVRRSGRSGRVGPDHVTTDESGIAGWLLRLGALDADLIRAARAENSPLLGEEPP